MNDMRNTKRGIELKSIYLTDSIFKELILSNLKEVDYIYLSSNNNLTQSQVKYLFTLKIDGVNINLLRNKNCPSYEINNFIKLEDKIYNIAIAHNSNLKQNQINKLIMYNDEDVNTSLQLNGLL